MEQDDSHRRIVSPLHSRDGLPQTVALECVGRVGDLVNAAEAEGQRGDPRIVACNPRAIRSDQITG